jgi:hypothetical protein
LRDDALAKEGTVMAWKHIAVAAGAAVILGAGAGVYAQQPPAQAGAAGAPDPVAAFKQSMQQGLAKIRAYEWVETTSISMKGEEKSRKQNRCYYGADGKVQEISLDQAPAAEQKQGGKPGRRGGGKLKEQVVENKKDEIQDYMKRAAALIKSYVPPDPAKIQAAKDAGRVTTTPQAGGKVRLVISQYLLPGDAVTVDLDTAAGRLTALGVNTYLDKPDEPVTLAVQMNALPDGALYAAQTTLDVKAKNITVVTQNSGHKPAAK